MELETPLGRVEEIIGPKLKGLAPDLEPVEAAKSRAITLFVEFSGLLGDRTSFAGDRLTLADPMIAPHVALLATTPEWERLSEGSSASPISQPPSVRRANWLARPRP